MKIENSNIQMSSNHFFSKTYKNQESAKYWNNTNKNLPPTLKNLVNKFISDEIKLSPDALEFSRKSRELLAEENAKKLEVIKTSQTNSPINLELTDEDTLKIRLLEELFSSLLHRRINFQIPANIKTQDKLPQISAENFNIQRNLSSQNRSLGWGLNYEHHQSFSESEAMSFQSFGTIKTKDGKEISFDLQLNMSRTFYSENHLSIKAGDALIDPLVINYDSPAAQVTSTKFSFDLDSDGKQDEISSLKEGSGFLALDLNKDGSINNGKELFGTESGNGFNDLAKYDTDNNNWIDENDPIFDKLRIWTKDKDGNSKLFALGEKGIGAIYLGNVSAEFSMKNNENESLAQSRNGGIFVKESGEVGTLQQVDFVV